MSAKDAFTLFPHYCATQSTTLYSAAVFKKAISLIAAVFLFTATSLATNYYLSSNGNDAANGKSSSTPWKTIAKLNTSANLRAGDSVLFHQGEIFYGTLIVKASGAPGRVIYYGSYGTGRGNPVITGFTSLSNWKDLGGSIWETTNAVSGLSTCNMVLVNGMSTPMGRYPNKSYLPIQSHTGAVTITSNSLTGAPNWTGAEVVIKKKRWIIDRNLITAQSGGTLTYTTGSSYEAQDQYGFFIQNDSRTLDTANEWYYSPSSKKLRIYSAGTPANVQMSTVDTLVYMLYKNNITFSGLSFTGANQCGFYIGTCSNLSIVNCTIDFCNNGIASGNWGGPSANFLLKNSLINHTNNNAVSTTNEFINVNISNNTIKNTGLIPGMGGSGDGRYEGLSIAGKNGLVQYNEVDTSGFIAIAFSGNSMKIMNNLVNYFCLLKDDGGGIYTEGAASGNTISSNVILNGIGNGDGTINPTGSSAMGIYCDNNSSGIQIVNNSVSYIGFAGIFLHDAHDITVKNNNVFDCAAKSILEKNDDENTFIKNITITNNILVGKDSGQLCFHAISLHNDIASFGTIDNNYYARPIDDSLVFDTQPTGEHTRNVYYTLAGWQTYSAYDLHSHKSPKKITDSNDLRFEYNATTLPVSVSLPYNYIDMTGASYNGVVKLAPYTSVILVKNGKIINQPPVANAGADQTIVLPVNTVNLSGSGTDTDGTVSSYAWTKISGPATSTIVSAASQNTTVNDLVEGVYKFELKVTDNQGATGADTIQVTVKPAIPVVVPNIPPVANAGADQTIVLPVNTLNLSGSGTDADGTLSSYTWSKISGPAASTIVNDTALNTSVTGLVEGVYKFVLRVTDNQGATGADTIQVTVKPAIPAIVVPNIPPVANAGADQSVVMPTNAVNLSGSGMDADGTISSYAWTEISGPTASTIANASSQNTQVNGLMEGVYQFELKVTDNQGATAADTIQVTVNPAIPVAAPAPAPDPHIPPVANAGADQTIMLPTNTVLLDGSATDQDGTITGYSWKQVSGPQTSWILSPNTPVTSSNQLVAGTYAFELTVTDNMGMESKDTQMVVVKDPSFNANPEGDFIKIYPNPVVTVATLEINSKSPDTKLLIIITNMQGQIVYKEEMVSPLTNIQHAINMSNLPKGMYTAIVYFNDRDNHVLKVVKM